MELHCFEIEAEDDSNDVYECSYDDVKSTGMFAVSDAIFSAVRCLCNSCDVCCFFFLLLASCYC